MRFSTSTSIFGLRVTAVRCKLTRILRLSFSALFICTAFAQVGTCQVIDELTAEGRSALKDLTFTPQEVLLVQDKAAKGDAKSQYVLGWMYFTGNSVTKDNERALQWMTKAANQDLRFAQTQTGLMYLASKDVPNNYSLAREWLLKGAEKNQADEWNALGVIYSQGLGVEVSGDEAIRCFKKAADLGFDKAEYNLGFQYATGKLVPNDFKEAAKWFQLAAKQDHIRATYSLGVMYRDGQGVPQDAAEALRLFQVVAEKHRFPPAQHNLGAMYYGGKSVPKDLVLAYMWVSLAADAGFEPSKGLLGTVSEKMTPEQIAEAKEKAQVWTKAHDNLTQ